jgi:hypothetical protein
MLQFVATSRLRQGYLYLMELVMKLPKDKPPYIGVVFTDDYAAASKNKTCANDHKDVFFSLLIIPKSRNRVDIKLIGESKGEYTDVRCNVDALIRFLYMTRNVKQYNFGHVVLKGTEHVVAKTMNKVLWVLKVNKIDISETG